MLAGHPRGEVPSSTVPIFDWFFIIWIPAALPHTVIRALCPRLQLYHRSVSRSLFEARGSGTPIVRGPGYEEDQLEVDLMDGHRTYFGSGYQMGDPLRHRERADLLRVQQSH